MVSRRKFRIFGLGLVFVVGCVLSAPNFAPELAAAHRTSNAISPVELNGHRFHRRVLDNGLRAVAVAEETDRVSIFLVIGAGRRHETPETTGLAHLVEHMMYTGTAKTGPGEHDRRVQELGGTSNAYTRDDITLFYDHDIPADRLAEVLSMEADRLRHLTFQPEAVDHERGRLLKEEAATWDRSQQLTELLEQRVFQHHPYGAGLLDEEGHTRAGDLDLATIRGFYDRYYQPNNAALVVAGGVEPSQALDAVVEAFGVLPAGPSPEAVPAEPDVAQARREILPSALSRDRLEWVWLAPELAHPDRPAMQVLAEVLAQQPTPGGSALSVSMGDRLDRDLFRMALTGPTAEEELEGLYRRTVSAPFDEAVVEQAKQRLLRSWAGRELRARPYFSLAAAFGVYEVLDRTDQLLAYGPAVKELQPDDLLRVARRHLDPQRRIAVLFQGTNAPQAPLPADSGELRRAAIEALEAGDLGRAIAAFTELLNRNPNKMHQVIYLSSRGEARLKERDYTGAIRDFETALGIIDYPDLRLLLDKARALQAGVPAPEAGPAESPRPEAEVHPTLPPDHPALPENHPPVGQDDTALEARLLARVRQNMKELEAWRGRAFQQEVTPEFQNSTQAKLGGYYDPEKKRLVLVRGREAEFSKGVLLHELHHALQDQHWDLLGLQKAARTSDSARALNGLIEGEAMLAVATIMGYDFSVHMNLPENGPIERERFEKVFAYGVGVRFVRALLDRGGWAAVDKAWENPPLSTRELFDPGRYPAEPAAALDLPSTEGELVREDQLGELEVRWWLVQDEENRSEVEALAEAFEIDRWRLVRLADGTEREHWDLRFATRKAASQFVKRVGAGARQDGWRLKAVKTQVRLWRPVTATDR